MKKEKICNYEDRQLAKLSKFQLPNHYKKVGVALAIVLLIVAIAFKFINDEPLWIKQLLKPLLLLSFLIISISKEVEEDEMIIQLRAQSYSLAFVVGVLYAFVQPYVNYAVAILIKPENASIDMSYFQVLFFMLLVQIAYFYKLKKKMS